MSHIEGSRGVVHSTNDWLRTHGKKKSAERVRILDIGVVDVFLKKKKGGVCLISHRSLRVPDSNNVTSITKMAFWGIIFSTITMTIRNLGLCFAGVTPIWGANVLSKQKRVNMFTL